MNLDSYELRARVAPALLVVLPVTLAVVAWFPDRFVGWGVLVALLTGSGAYALVGQLARDNGRTKEARLFLMWDGSPTTRQLRHRHTSFDWITLSRYHTYLATRVGVPSPSELEERAEPHAADQVYHAYTHFLREFTRDRKQYPLVFAENVNYGFRRNLWGMKPAGILLSVLGILAALLRIGLSLLGEGEIPMAALVAIVLCTLLFVWWCLRVTPAWVRTAADAYADRLLGACTQQAR